MKFRHGLAFQAVLALHPRGARRQTLALQAVLALSLLLAASFSSRAAPLAGVVTVVIDGDTVLFRPDHFRGTPRAFLKIRLADIDAPEKNQPQGKAATRALQALVLNQRATLEVVATDVYERKVAHLAVGSLQVNAEMVRRGFAWASTRGRDAALLASQNEARAARRGLWADAAPMPPWVWRRAQPASVR